MYRDKGDAPRALDNFQNSISLIDTTECDSSAYAFLSKVYAETAMILYNQGLYSNALANISHAIDYASLSGDTLRMLSYEAQIPSIYSEQKKYSKAIAEALKMYHRYLNFNRPAEANTCLVSVFVSLMNMGKYHEAKKYIDTYIANSLFTGSNGINEKGEDAFSYYLARYYNGVGKGDSAIYYIRKAEKSNVNRVLIYREMVNAYKAIGMQDSIIKYSDIYCKQTDSVYRSLETYTMAKMQSLYNYSESEKIASEKEAETADMRLLIYVVISAVLILSIIIAFYISDVSRKKKREIIALNARYSAELTKYREAQNLLKVLKESCAVNSDYIKEKEAEIEELKKSLAEFRDKDYGNEWNSVSQLDDTQIVNRLHQYAAEGCKASNEDFALLRAEINKFFPYFFSDLDKFTYKLNFRETEICILVVARFLPSEMSVLMDVSSQTVSNIRTRLLAKLFPEMKGGAAVFDCEIRKIAERKHIKIR